MLRGKDRTKCNGAGFRCMGSGAIGGEGFGLCDCGLWIVDIYGEIGELYGDVDMGGVGKKDS